MRMLLSLQLLVFQSLNFAPAAAQAGGDARRVLMELERTSHQKWLERDVLALDALMAPEFHFVVMNGAVEPKELIVGSGTPSDSPRQRMLEVRSLSVDPEEVMLHGETAVVISRMSIDAVVAGRTLPNEMRVLSVFVRDEPEGLWLLLARSITPVTAPLGP